MPAERTMEFLEPLMASLPPMSLHLLTGLLVGGFTVISLILGIAGARGFARLSSLLSSLPSLPLSLPFSLSSSGLAYSLTLVRVLALAFASTSLAWPAFLLASVSPKFIHLFDDTPTIQPHLLPRHCSQQVEAGVFPPRGPLYKFFVSDAESYKQYRQPFRTIVAIFLVAFYAVFFFGPPYLIWREMYAEGLAAATKCVATRKKFGGLQCSVGCVVQGGNCVPL
eukprot:scaffold111278_cov34-Tisochrysis_lutea.AAC.1